MSLDWQTDPPIWDDNPCEASGNTAYGFYDNDSEFQWEAPRFARWAARRLGYPMVDIEMEDKQFYECLEEAIWEYTAQVNQFNIRQNLWIAQGSPTSSNLTQLNINTSGLGRIIQLSQDYGSEFGAGGTITWHSASIAVKEGRQDYDLNALVSTAVENGKKIEVKRIFHYGTPAVSRIYDPFIETGLARQDILKEFGWTGLSTAILYTLFPVYEDLLRIQAIEFHDQIRRSAYSFELINNQLRIFPVPTSNYNLWIQYILTEDRGINPAATGSISGSVQSGVQSDYSNIQYNIIPYSQINDTGQQWIRKYALALCKETLGFIRSKYATVPIPNGETTLDGSTLRSEAAAEKDALIKEIRENLEDTGLTKQLEKKTAEEKSKQDILRLVPLKIYVAGFIPIVFWGGIYNKVLSLW